MKTKPKKIGLKKGYYDEPWELIEESKNYFIARYPGSQVVDALSKEYYEIVKDQKCMN